MIRFIHIPKTAGQSVINWLEENKIEFLIGTRKNYKGLHKPAKYFLKENLPRFSIVRNPYDRLVSYYTYYKRIAKETNVEWNVTFEEIVNSLYWDDSEENNFLKIPAKIPHHRLTQLHHITNDDGIVIIDKILYFENLQDDLENYFGNQPIKLKQINASNLENYQSFYNDTLQEKVYLHFEEDFKTLGYNKEL